MRKLIVGIDVDDTVCDMLGAICAKAGWPRKNRRVVLPENIKGWGLPKWMYKEMDEDLYDKWARPIQGAREAVDQIREQEHRVVFVSSCVRDTVDAKVRWLMRLGFISDPNEMIAASDKSLVRVDVLIDDAPHNVEDFPGEAILVSQPHNLSHQTSRRRIAGIWEAPEEVREIANRTSWEDLREAGIHAAQLLVQKYGAVTVSDIRAHLEESGAINGDEPREVMSALGHVCRAAGLVPGERIRDDRYPKTHHNIRRVWRAA